MRGPSSSTYSALFVLAVIVVTIAGWIMNLFAFMASVNDGVTGVLIARAIGLFVFPLGAVFGWFL